MTLQYNVERHKHFSEANSNQTIAFQLMDRENKLLAPPHIVQTNDHKFLYVHRNRKFKRKK